MWIAFLTLQNLTTQAPRSRERFIPLLVAACKECNFGIFLLLFFFFFFFFLSFCAGAIKHKGDTWPKKRVGKSRDLWLLAAEEERKGKKIVGYASQKKKSHQPKMCKLLKNFLRKHTQIKTSWIPECFSQVFFSLLHFGQFVTPFFVTTVELWYVWKISLRWPNLIFFSYE